MTKLEELADLIFPNVAQTVEDLEIKYPKRSLKEGAEVTRFAPSPTGFLHTGALFTSLVNKKIAMQTGGIFYLRVEDTDKKREVEGSIKCLTEEMMIFGINPIEGAMSDILEIGEYGPYKQSNREEIYKICAKHLITKGLAYPCFCNSEELGRLRDSQEKNKVRPGYYGSFARCRNNSVEDMIARIKEGEEYIIRFKSPGSHMKKVAFTDKVRGRIEQAENDTDIVLIKSDGIPTYHFAHVVDDHFMRTTTVIRGEEWVASVPLHLDLFKAMEFEPVNYSHVPTMMVIDGESKRKLSKRKDPQAAVSFFITEGYLVESVIEYLLTVINSDYEPWRRENEAANALDFIVKLDKMSVAGALFDMDKLIDISKDVIGKMNSSEVLHSLVAWAKEYDKEFLQMIESNLDYAKNILAIERDGAVKVRKDFAKMSDVKPNVFYFYNSLFEKDIEENGYLFGENIKIEEVKELLKNYISHHNTDCDKDIWFSNLKEFAQSEGYCSNMKEYKQNKEAYKGSIADVAGIIRVAITNRQNTPDIYSIMKVMGDNEVINRIERIIKKR